MKHYSNPAAACVCRWRDRFRPCLFSWQAVGAVWVSHLQHPEWACGAIAACCPWPCRRGRGEEAWHRVQSVTIKLGEEVKTVAGWHASRTKRVNVRQQPAPSSKTRRSEQLMAPDAGGALGDDERTQWQRQNIYQAGTHSYIGSVRPRVGKNQIDAQTCPQQGAGTPLPSTTNAATNNLPRACWMVLAQNWAAFPWRMWNPRRGNLASDFEGQNGQTLEPRMNTTTTLRWFPQVWGGEGGATGQESAASSASPEHSTGVLARSRAASQRSCRLSIRPVSRLGAVHYSCGVSSLHCRWPSCWLA